LLVTRSKSGRTLGRGSMSPGWKSDVFPSQLLSVIWAGPVTGACAGTLVQSLEGITSR
jgi:hypothetical protein